MTPNLSLTHGEFFSGDGEQVDMQALAEACEELIRRDPAGLDDLVAGVRPEQLRTPQHRHQLRYYRALGAGLRDRLCEAVALLEALLAEPDLEPEIRGRALNAAALFAQGTGDYQRARDCYTASQALWSALGNPLREGIARNNLGALLYELHEYDQAERSFLAAAELFTAAGSAYHQAQAFNELGLLCRDRGHWKLALDYFQQASALCEQDDAPELLARVVNNQGEVLLLCGDYDAAESAFARAAAGMCTRLYLVDVHINRGLTVQARGGDDQALQHYQAALDLAGEIGRAEVMPLIHYRIGQTCERLQRAEQARTSYAAAVAEVEARRAPLRDEGLQIGLMGRWQQVYEAAISHRLACGDSAGAFDYAERARARAFADLLARHGAGLSAPQVAPVTAAETRAALAPGDLLLVYVALGLHDPETRLLRAMPERAAGLRACLAPQPRLIVLALTQAGIQAVECPLNPNALQSTSPVANDGRRFLTPGVLRKLDAALLAPLAPQIAAADRLIVVPHGPLHQVPFAALSDPAGQTLLDRAPRLQLAPSATALVRVLAARRGAPTRPCLALGYDAGGAGLRHTEVEARAVARVLGGVAWRGRQGVREALARAAESCRVLHLACHGEFQPDDPLSSWLEVGPDERLSAADVLAGPRLQADLVTLSACRSGVSRVLRGDEPMGLVRAFLCAGARAVLVTLWPVDDTSARLLMERFYSEFAATGDCAAALQTAQRTLRDIQGEELWAITSSWGDPASAFRPDDRPYADPQHWAGYVLIGAL